MKLLCRLFDHRWAHIHHWHGGLLEGCTRCGQRRIWDSYQGVYIYDRQASGELTSKSSSQLRP